MKKRFYFLLHWPLVCLPSVRLLKRPLREEKFQTAQPTLNGEVIFYSPSIVRIVKYPSAEMPEKKKLSGHQDSGKGRKSPTNRMETRYA